MFSSRSQFGGQKHAESHHTPSGGVPLNYLFIHIPKTAGTSFRKSLVKGLGKDRVLSDYGNRKRETSAEVQAAVYKSGDVLGLELHLRDMPGRIISGHFTANKYAGMIGLSNAVTFLREPIARVLSHYRHRIWHKGCTDTLMDFARLEENRDLQSRLLWNVDPALIGIVGITEHFRESIDLVNANWGWQLPYREDNLGSSRPDFRVEPPPDELEAIASLNLRDKLLYDRALQVFRNSWECLEKGFEEEPRGVLSRVREGNAVSGWAFFMNSQQAAEVEILINGEVRGRTAALDFRAHLAGWGVPRHGYVGFRIESANLSEGDEVELRDARYGLLLDCCTV